MSSMRNAVSRRAFKERAQPQGREKLGILEKHKDYVLRAKDFKQKTEKLKALKQKAQDRNPDEFSFAMMSSKTKKGIKVADRGNVAMSVDTVRLLKTQDAGYVKTMLQQTRREIQKLERESGGVLIKGNVKDENAEINVLAPAGGKGKGGNHLLFVDNDEEKERFDLDAWRAKITGAGHDSDNKMDDVLNHDNSDSDSDSNPLSSSSSHQQSLNRANKKIPHYELVKKQEQAAAARRQKRTEIRARNRSRASLVSKLEALRKREKTLAAAEAELDVQRARMSNQPVKGVTKKGLKFRSKERRR